MTERIGVEITARDGASRTFAQVASGADKLDASFEKVRRTSLNMSAVGDQLGRAFGSATVFLADSARIAQEAEVSQQRLQASIEATGASYDDYAERLEAAGEAAVQMAFDDEEAADAISFLTQATGDATTAINDLGLVMDIARGRGIGLAEAAKIVAAAEQERFTSLRRIGIVLDENATKEEAIAALQQKYSGQAAAYAETTAGQIGRLSQQFENAREGLAEYSEEATTLALVIPTVTSAVSALNTALIATAGISLVGIAPALIAIGLAAGTAYVGYEALTQQGNVTTQSMEDVVSGAENVTEALLALAAAGDAAAVGVGGGAQSILGQMSKDIKESFALFGEQTTWRGGDAEATAIHDANMARLRELEAQYGNWHAASEDVAEAERDLLAVLNNSGAGRELALRALERLNAEYAAGNISAETYASGVDLIAGQLAAYDFIAGKATKTTTELGEAMGTTSGYAAAHAAGMERHAQLAEDVAKAQEQLTNQFELTRNEYMATTDALATGFRVYIQNTDAIASQSQAVADWAEEMIKARGEWSRLDELVQKGLISGESGEFDAPTDYGRAQRAYDQIIKSNEAINDYVDAIQVKMAPALAELTRQQEQHLAALLKEEPAQQMLALAYMDSATSAQALSLAQGLVDNPDLFAPMIEQAAKYDTGLALILEDLGLIERDREGNVTVTGIEGAQSKLDVLTDAIEALTQAQWVASFDGDVSAAEAAFEVATGMLVDWDNSEGSADVTVNDYATATLSNISALLAGLQDRTVTVTTINQTLNPFMLGGVAGYADGGMVTIRAGEAGPERLDFPSGRNGLAVTDGLYTVPVGTYVNTAPATAMSTGNWGGVSVTININGPASWDDAAEQVSRKIVPAIERAMREHERSMGGR